MKTKNREFKSCFISAPFGINLGSLTRVLDRAEIHWEWARSNLDLSDRLPGDLRKIIRGVDFEVGLAVGMGKPVLLIVADRAKIPSDLAGIPTVQHADVRLKITLRLVHGNRLFKLCRDCRSHLSRC
jgi:hypothetical protein